MRFELDDLWLEKMEEWGWRNLTTLQKRRLYRVIMVAVIGVSYLIDTLLLSLFAVAGTIDPVAPLAYGIGGLVHVALFATLHWSGFSERFSNPHMTLWQMAYAIAMQLTGIVLAPQITSFFLGVMFVIYAFGTLRITLKEALAVWLGACIAIASVLGMFVHQEIGITHPSRWVEMLVALSFATILLRSIALGYYSTAMRVKILERSRMLENAATHDALTGLLNRNVVLPALADQVDLVRRNRMIASVAMIDIDKFKVVNDTLGHVAGDHVLQRLARMIESALRESDMVGRYGGEEFIVLLPTVDLAEANQAMERVREGIAAMLWPELRGGLRVTVSCGVTQIAQSDDVDTVIAHADQALYAAKRAGRNRVFKFDARSDSAA